MSTAAIRVWGGLSCDLHAARLRYFAATGAAEVQRADGAVAVVTGSQSNIDNGIVAAPDEVSPEAAAELVGWVRGHDVPASWICEGVAAADGLAEALNVLGCHEETTGVGMGAELAAVRGVGVEIDGVRLEEVESEGAFDSWLDVAQIGGLHEGAEDRKALRRLYTAGGVGRSRPHRHWLARRGETAVGLATAFFAGETVLLEHVAVVPAERRQGIGTALAMLRIREARRLGCRLAVLGPAPEVRPLYERLNFTVTPSPLRRWWYLS